MIEMVEKTSKDILEEIIRLRKRIIYLQKEYIKLSKEGNSETTSR